MCNVGGTINDKKKTGRPASWAPARKSQLKRSRFGHLFKKMLRETLVSFHSCASSKLKLHFLTWFGWLSKSSKKYPSLVGTTSPAVFAKHCAIWLPFIFGLKDKKFGNEEKLKDFFDSRSEEFYASGICYLPRRWAKVIDTNGENISIYDFWTIIFNIIC